MIIVINSLRSLFVTGVQSTTVDSDSSSDFCESPAPEKWKNLQVGNWIDGICEQFEIEEADVSDLKTLNGKGLNKLSEKDWIRRSPKQGDLFYIMWMDLEKEKSSGEPDSSEPSGMLEFFNCERAECLAFLLFYWIISETLGKHFYML